ncbi:NACHT and WD repeat domain-containing protein, partial [Nocardia neocaledoniensis]|uniref:NACHT and WD repeat domain-containing protein n=1 Tax=Nocardia neocaledoniensis TaxID=236511 RepID=UPI0021BE4AB9
MDLEPADGLDDPGISVGGAQSVDARHSQGVVIGDHTTANVTIYNNYQGVLDRPAPGPMITSGGRVEFPYRGLSWFDEHDAPLFFGREHAIAEVMDQLEAALTEPRIVAVGGVSGSGKTSLVRAGVLPRIRAGTPTGLPGAQEWPRSVVFSPGSSPVKDLALATARATTGLSAVSLQQELERDPRSFAVTAAQIATTGTASGASQNPSRRLLVVIDQFERIYTQCTDHAERERFVAALHAAATCPDTETGAPAALVLIVVRADFEARCAELDGLADTIQSRCLLTSMTELQLRLAITEPAKAAKSRVEDELTDHLIREVRAASRTADNTTSGPISGARVLPLVSDALDRAWRQHSGDTLTLADYEAVGGIDTAVARAADAVYTDLTPRQQLIARKVFTRLTVVGADGTDTADRVTRTELTTTTGDDARDVEAVLEAFADQRLITLGIGTVEISHEVLLATWPRLRDEWLADTRADRTVLTRLHTAAITWNSDARDKAHLYTGSVLETATATTTRTNNDPRHHHRLSDLEQEFLAASTHADRRRTLQRRAFTAVLLFLVVALTIVAGVAVQRSREADLQTRIAVARDLIGQSQLLANTKPTASRLAALTAWRVHASDEARAAMRAAALNPLPTGRELLGTTGNSLVFHPDREIAATYSDAGHLVQLWNTATGTRIAELPGTNGNSLVLRPNGKIAATYNSGKESLVQLWDLSINRSVEKLPPGRYPRSVSSGGEVVATSSDAGLVQLWNT